VNTQQILQSLEYLTIPFPREAVQAAIAQREEITPALLESLTPPNRALRRMWEDGEYMLPQYAMYLLAQFRETRAYPLIVEFFSVPGEISLDATGDFVTEDLGRVLASVCGGDMSLIQQLVENEAANEYVRDAALRALVTLVACGIKPREEVISYFQSLFRGRLKRYFPSIWHYLVSCSDELYPEELYDDIKQAFEEGLVDEDMTDLGWTDETLARGKEAVLNATRENGHHRLVEDTVKEMEWWACFQPPKPVAPKKGQKVGRNEPCPCGSGKKYKHCCGARN